MARNSYNFGPDDEGKTWESKTYTPGKGQVGFDFINGNENRQLEFNFDAGIKIERGVKSDDIFELGSEVRVMPLREDGSHVPLRGIRFTGINAQARSTEDGVMLEPEK